MYRDYSREAEDKLLEILLNDSRSKQHFPIKLHQMVTKTEEDGFTHIICWLPHGRAFFIHDKNDFMKEVLPLWFRMKKYCSFERQLTLYGFRKIKKGIDKGAFYHELFLHGMLFLCCRIQRVTPRSSSSSASVTDVDLYSFPNVGVSSPELNKTDSQTEQQDNIGNPTIPIQVPEQSKSVELMFKSREVQLGDRSTETDLDTKMPPKSKLPGLCKTVQTSENKLTSTFDTFFPTCKKGIPNSATLPGREELLLKLHPTDNISFEQQQSQTEENMKYLHYLGTSSTFSAVPSRASKSSGATLDFQVPNPLLPSANQKDLLTEPSNFVTEATSQSKTSRRSCTDKWETQQLTTVHVCQLNQEVDSKQMNYFQNNQGNPTDNWTQTGTNSDFSINEDHLFMNDINAADTDQSHLLLPLNENATMHGIASLKSNHEKKNLECLDASSEFSINESHWLIDNLVIPGIDQSQLLMPLGEDVIFDDMAALLESKQQANKKLSKSKELR